VAVACLFWSSVGAAQGEGAPAPEPAPARPSLVPAATAPADPSASPLSPSTPPPSPALTGPGGSPPGDAGLRGELDALREEVRALRTRVESAPPPPTPLPAPAEGPAGVHERAGPTPRPLGYEPYWPWATPPEGLTLGGYLQSEYIWSQSSQDQLAQGGALLNKDRFLIRRARPSLIGEWEYVAIALELDANTTNGPQVDLRKAEASIQYRPDRTKPPIVMATLGQFDTPFGYELVESPRTRWFMERSTASLGFWPGEPDLGVRLAGALGFFRWTIAAVNGEPLGENSSYALEAPLAEKTVLFRFGFDTTPRDDLQLAGGVSSLRGTGFDPGTDATNATLQYTDVFGTGSVSSMSDLSVTGAKVATPSQNFQRWAAGADLRMNYRWRPGVLKVYGEFMLGSNMDRGQYFANPVLTGIDQRELGFYVGALQEITPYGMVGFRYDYYDPNSNAFDKREGQLVPYSEAIQTSAILVGVSMPDRARLVFEYDIVRDALARSAIAIPANLPSNTWTLRLQVQL
jgi:hypothetical protein